MAAENYTLNKGNSANYTRSDKNISATNPTRNFGIGVNYTRGFKPGAGVGNLLLETGGNILLETGGVILLE